MVLIGLLLGAVGADTQTGLMRFTFGVPELTDGIGFVVVAMGVFGFGEIIANLAQGAQREVFTANVKGLFPRGEDLKAAWKAVVRGTAVGALLGILPGGGRSARIVRRLHAREKDRRTSGAIRQGRDRGRRRARVGQQRRRANLVHPLLSLGIPPTR
jgi:TctA family transporter